MIDPRTSRTLRSVGELLQQKAIGQLTFRRTEEAQKLSDEAQVMFKWAALIDNGAAEEGLL